jgi:Ca2+-transporting ATPase
MIARPPMSAPIPWHSISTDEVATRWTVDPAEGLTRESAAERRRQLGPNLLPQAPKEPAWKQLGKQFLDPLVVTLLVAAAVAGTVAWVEGGGHGGGWLSRFSDVIAILLIVFVNALLGFFQERRAERAIDALQKMAAPSAKVLREGGLVVLPAAVLVPGDVVELEAGDQVPADVRVIQAADVEVTEAALTGEAATVAKDSRDLPEDTVLAERRNMVYMGTALARGRARGIVVQTGATTELGRTGALMSDIRKDETPLEQRLAKFGKLVLLGCLAVSALIFVFGLFQGGQSILTMLLVAVSVAVAAIPEGLPAITTITLALGMQRMARRHAIVRKLAAVETLGCTSIICSDKTGTLTQNEMTVRQVMVGLDQIAVTGEGYVPKGRFELAGAEVHPSDREDLRMLLECAAICNGAQLEEAPEGWRIVGDPTEGALLAMAGKGDIRRESLLEGRPVVREIPFASDRRMMTIVVRDASGQEHAFVKGSADKVIPRCRAYLRGNVSMPMDAEVRAEADAVVEKLAGQALRVLAFAHKPVAGDDPEANLELIGLVGMMDPPRPEVRTAVAECRRAGIRVVMITGDHKATAVAIGHELDIFRPEDEAMTGAELDKVADEDLEARVDRIRVFARVTAEHKLRIVRALKRKRAIVAMTGDGVNDGPALKEAAIGIAMGKGGTDVAREASELVLADDNFATIVEAVREGRAIFRNIQKFVYFLLSSNMGLVLTVFAASFFPSLLPLTALQILWINLVTNGVPALALGVDPPEEGQMKVGPRPTSEGILGARAYGGMFAVGIIMAACAMYLYFRAPTPQMARTMVFSLLAFSPLFHTLNCRSSLSSILQVGLFTNRFLWLAVGVSGAVQLLTMLPVLRPVFKTAWMNAHEWALVLGLSALPIPLVEAWKAFERIRAGGRGPEAAQSAAVEA